MLAEILGWIGFVCASIRGLPQVYKCIKNNKSEISFLFLIFWLIGEICFLIAVLIKFNFVSWLLLNYICNIFFIILIMIFYKRNEQIF